MKTLAALLLSALLCADASAQGAPDCSSPEAQQSASSRMDSTFKSIDVARKKREAELDGDLRATEKRLGWAMEDRRKFFVALMASPKFVAFENEKVPLKEAINTLMTAGGQRSGPSTSTGLCEFVAQLEPIVEQIRLVNERQYDFMGEELRAAK